MLWNTHLKWKHELQNKSLEIGLRLTQKIQELFDKYNLSLKLHFPQVNDLRKGGFSRLWLLLPATYNSNL